MDALGAFQMGRSLCERVPHLNVSHTLPPAIPLNPPRPPAEIACPGLLSYFTSSHRHDVDSQAQVRSQQKLILQDPIPSLPLSSLLPKLPVTEAAKQKKDSWQLHRGVCACMCALKHYFLKA